jgi:hypothetical protein
MKRYLVSPNLLVLVLVVTTASILTARGQNEKSPIAQDVTTSYSLPSQKITFLQPVIVTFKVVNGTGTPVSLDLGFDRKGGFAFSLTGPDGVKLELPAYTIREGLSRIGTVSILPRETYTQSLLLNEWYNFAKPGEYKLEGHLTNPILVNDGSRREMDPGFSLAVEVGARDELALAKACDDLANQIDAANSYQEAADAAFALTYVNDPIAVPYLRRALFAQKLVELFAINGLEKIANDAAVRVLVEGLKMEFTDTADMSRWALQRIRNQTPDPQIRQQIDNSMK